MFKTDTTPAKRQESGHEAPFITKRSFAIDCYWEREKSAFSNKLTGGISTTLHNKPHIQEALVNTK